MILENDEKRRTASDVAREVTSLIGVMIKTGAAQPGRDAMRLLEPMIKGEYDGRARVKKPKAKKQGG